MSIEQKRKAVDKLAKIANKRLRKLEKEGFTDYAYRYARIYSDAEKPRFKENTSKIHPSSLTRELRLLEKFLSASTSTIGGYKKTEKKKKQALESVFQRNENLSKLDLEEVNREDVYSFLASEEYKNLRKYLSSEQIIETFTESLYEKNTPDQIKQAFEDFKNSKITYGDMRKKLLGEGRAFR